MSEERYRKKLFVLFIASLIIMAAIGMGSKATADTPTDVVDKDDIVCPEGGLVIHPCRQPDALITVKLSHYWPPLGGPNCFTFVNGECLSNMSSGYPWQDWVDKAAACPASLPFGTIVEFNNRRFICLDRGGKVVQSGNTYWVDTLTEYPLGVYGSEVIGSLWYPIWYLSK